MSAALVGQIRHYLIGCLLVALCASTAGASALFPGVDAKWRHYQSDNFELISRAGDSLSRQTLVNLEKLRAFTAHQFRLVVRNPVPVTIYYFTNNRDFRAYRPPEYDQTDNLIGYYFGYPDRDVISLSAATNSETSAWVVQTNYAMHMLRATGGQVPSWLNRGLAMLLGTAKPDGDRMIFGEADPMRLRLAKENPSVDLDLLFRITEGISQHRDQEQSNIFHARAWAVLHYWYLGQSEIPASRVTDFIQFILSSPQSDDPEARRQEFERCFGVGYEEMNRKIGRYMRAGNFRTRRVEVPAGSYSREISVRPLPIDEVHERLAELAVRNRQDAAGKFTLLEAARGPRGARALEALGTLALRQNDERQNHTYWKQAIEAGSRNPAVLRFTGLSESARWFSSFDYYFRLPTEKAEELRALLAKSIAAAPLQTDAYEMLAWTEAYAPQPDEANIRLVQEKLPSLENKAQTLLAFAMIRARADDKAGALKLLDEAEKLDPRRQTRQAIINARAIFEGRSNRR